jgi:hypothetical protein
LNKAEEDGRLQGVSVCASAPSFNHLLFADDSLILLKVNEENSAHLQNILSLYEDCSGQTVNFLKSIAIFSPNTPRRERKKVMDTLHIETEARNEKYLGLPVYVGRSKKGAFAYLKGRMWGKIQGWDEKLMSRAAKDVLIKACAQAIPTFAMSCFDITKCLCDDMSVMICRFWWAQQKNEKKVHWISWKKMTQPKKEGGLGFRDLYLFNLAMLARQVWRILTDPESLCARVLRAKYFPERSVLEATRVRNMSYTWRSILKGVEVIKKGLIWRVGNGEEINIWNDPWLNRDGPKKPITSRGQNIITRVSERINPATGQWDVQLVSDVFYEQDVSTILATPLRIDYENFPAWSPDPKGAFTVKSAYKVLAAERDPNEDGAECSGVPKEENEFAWLQLWAQPCAPKTKHLLWRLAHGSLPWKLNYKRRGMEIDTICPMCSRLDEDGGHIFIHCKQVKAVWRLLDLEETRLLLGNCHNAKDLLMRIFGMEKEKRLLVIALMWQWWTT